MAMAMAAVAFPPPHPFPCLSSPSLGVLSPNISRPPPCLARARALFVRCATKRTGKQRYPSEKKKLQRRNKSILLQNPDISDRNGGFWRLSKLGVSALEDPGKDFLGVSLPLLQAIAKVLEFPVPTMLPEEAFSVIRKSFDARKVLKEAKFVYTVDMDVKKLLDLEPRTWDFVARLEPKLGLIEYFPDENSPTNLISILHESKEHIDGFHASSSHAAKSNGSYNHSNPRKPKVAVVGSGPSGLFASLVLGELGAEVTLIERGQPVDQRGRDIGALVVRRILQAESNFCFGEGGAGTWSDGKLVTRIGRNSDSVQAVMKTLVHFGAPRSILIDGKPHLGTDRLVRLLGNFREHLIQLGVDIKFGTRLNDLMVESGQVIGLSVSNVMHDYLDNNKLLYDAVVLAVGHSARDVYRMLLQHNVDMVPKDFAVGLRVEHPQELINNIQYSTLSNEVNMGRGRVPVADYKVINYVSVGNNENITGPRDPTRSCYSFCMCPGGQIVLTSTDPSELCINGMSFSRRSSRWANAALVVTVSSDDFELYKCHGPLAGIELQRAFERKAALMGGGNFVLPAQNVIDFLDDKLPGSSLPSSSYRLGVQAAKLHELFPSEITEAIKQSILTFDKELPGFISEDALLHGVETRTSSPVKILRHSDTYESTSLRGLYPIGEGAGYAGGIVSAAVDGMYCGFAAAKRLGLYHGDIESIMGSAQKNTGFVKY